MDGDEDVAVARTIGLSAAAAAFPEEIAVAVALARVQRELLAAMPLDPSDAP